ncbi:MAG: transporter, partial [Pseudonocardiales bacterium]|nr:transporter [Pseudonocardiales bacterium]
MSPVDAMPVPGRAMPAEHVYYVYAVGFGLCFWLTATLNVLYMATDVGLSPLQMVMVGSVLEASVFLFEIPTGLVADLVSRRLSVLIGLVLVGVGFLVQGVGSSFAAMLIAQVIWGIGYTFTSGADQAWLADEIGVDQLARVLTRAQQLRLGATFAGIVAAGGLGLVDIQVPLIASGAGFVVLALVLAPLMRETGFVPTPRGERETFAQMGRSLSAGLAVARRRPVVRAFLVIGLLVGLSSEAVDRLWTVRVVEDFDAPGLLGQTGPVALFALISLVGTAIALAASLTVSRVAPERVQALHPSRLVAILVLLQVAGIVGIALLGSLWLVLAALWVRGAAAAIAAPIQ